MACSVLAIADTEQITSDDLLLRRVAVGVFDDRYVVDRHQPFANHVADDRQQALHSLGSVDPGDDQGQWRGQVDQMSHVDSAVCPEPGDPFGDRTTRRAFGFQRLQDGQVQRLAVNPLAFFDVDLYAPAEPFNLHTRYLQSLQALRHGD